LVKKSATAKVSSQKIPAIPRVLRVPKEYEKRVECAPKGKRVIAELAVASIPAGSVVFLDAGTTIFVLAEVLAKKCPGPLCVVTNSLRVGYLLGSVQDVDVRMLGGRLMAEELCLLSAETMAGLAGYHFDLAFLSAGGMTRKGIWNADERFVIFQRTVISRAAEVWFCLDRFKVGIEEVAFLAPWREADVLLTDATYEDLVKAQIPLRGIKVMTPGSVAVDRAPRQVSRRKAIY
jgi:DeoR/GlpR family transcriptional regulator of sugar metabolism